MRTYAFKNIAFALLLAGCTNGMMGENAVKGLNSQKDSGGQTQTPVTTAPGSIEFTASPMTTYRAYGYNSTAGGEVGVLVNLEPGLVEKIGQSALDSMVSKALLDSSTGNTPVKVTISGFNTTLTFPFKLLVRFDGAADKYALKNVLIANPGSRIAFASLPHAPAQAPSSFQNLNGDIYIVGGKDKDGNALNQIALVSVNGNTVRPNSQYPEWGQYVLAHDDENPLVIPPKYAVPLYDQLYQEVQATKVPSAPWHSNIAMNPSQSLAVVHFKFGAPRDLSNANNVQEIIFISNASGAPPETNLWCRTEYDLLGASSFKTTYGCSTVTGTGDRIATARAAVTTMTSAMGTVPTSGTRLYSTVTPDVDGTTSYTPPYSLSSVSLTNAWGASWSSNVPNSGNNGTPSVAAKVEFSTNPSASGASGAKLAVQPVVRVLDSNGVLVNTHTGALTLAAYSNSTCSTVASSVTVTGDKINASAGIGTFSNVTVTGPKASYYLGVGGLSNLGTPLSKACIAFSIVDAPPAPVDTCSTMTVAANCSDKTTQLYFVTPSSGSACKPDSNGVNPCKGTVSPSTCEKGVVGSTVQYYPVCLGSTAILASCSPISGKFYDCANSTNVTAPPLAPTSVAANANNSTGKITVSWTAAYGATGYDVYRSTSMSGSFTKVNSSALTTLSYTDTLPSSGTYYYAVRAKNGSGDSPNSALASATVQVQPATNIDTCTALYSNPCSEPTSTIYFTTNTSICGKLDSNGQSPCAGSATPNTCQRGISTNPVTYYAICIRPGASGVFDQAGCTYEGPKTYNCSSTPTPMLPSAPTNLTATVQSNSVYLKWNAVSGSGVTYSVYRAPGTSTSYTKVSVIDVNGTTYTDTPPGYGSYSYVVRAKNTYGESANSAAKSVTLVKPITDTCSAILCSQGTKYYFSQSSSLQYYCGYAQACVGPTQSCEYDGTNYTVACGTTSPTSLNSSVAECKSVSGGPAGNQVYECKSKPQ